VSTNSVQRASVEPPCLEAVTEKRWYAAYTCAQHENLVAQQLNTKGVEVFLPIVVAARQRKDRLAKLRMPLFPGYVFVRMRLEDRLGVLSVPSVVRLVSFNGKPTPIAATEIEAIQTCMASGLGIEPHPYLAVGQRVRIRNGALRGVEGIIVRREKTYRLVVSVQLLQQALSIEVQSEDVEAIERSDR